MDRRQPLRIPIRDRRERTRIVTLRNFGKAMVVSLVLLTGVQVQSHFRHESGGDYGRIVGREMQPTRELPQRPAPLVATPIVDQTAADPLLVAPAARAQALGVDVAPEVSMPSAVATDTIASDSRATKREGDEHVTIVGGPSGVDVTTGGSQAPLPLLSGGIFKQ